MSQDPIAVKPSQSASVRLVAIGASAGGLEAFLEIVGAIPADTGLALVLIQHLDPRHGSMLAGIVAGATSIPVQEVVDGMRVESDHIYVIPPGREMTLDGDVLRLAPRSPKVPHRPIDGFFRSLANDRESAAIGVVLSGNDADGAVGMQAIRDAGGITFAQEPATAKFDVMPRAAAVAADFVLPPGGIAGRLVTIARDEIRPSHQFDRIFKLLGVRYPVDFSHFKRASIERRILRRVLLGNHQHLSGYVDTLESDPGAIEDLYHDLLIGVTSFFREPSRFDALKTVVFPAIAQSRGAQDHIRVWVAGCSTGEEVYSLGISLIEFLDDSPDAPRISIYGTDINEQSLAKARTAVFSHSALAEVSSERIGRFFTPVQGGFKVSKRLRDLCVFAQHDVTRDPPYSRIDLVTCCNVLIYFDPELQKKAVTLLQYALAPGGFLMLGSSENLPAAAHQLSAVSSKPLIYRKQPIADAMPRTAFAPPSTRADAAPSEAPALARPAGNILTESDDAFLGSRFAPCGVLVNEQLEITRFRGDVAPFIALEPGDASLSLFRLIRHDEILAALRPAVRRSFRDRAPVSSENILIADGDARRAVSFDVMPFSDTAPGQGQSWIIFREHGEQDGSNVSPGNRSEVDGLKRALATAIADRENVAADAASAAEEARSSDEELRSANEELETAKEELQSANEELSTLNDELQIRNTALVRMNDDIENLLSAVELPILFVGTDLNIRRFNVTAGTLLNLRPDSIGRSLRESNSTIDVAQLVKLAGAVMETASGADVEVQDSGGCWRLLRIRPYRKTGGQVDGAIVAVLDIDALKQTVFVAERATRAAKMLSEAGAMLASSLDYETTLESVARLSTAGFADWCAVDLIGEDGAIRHLTVSHVNPVLRDLVLQFQKAAFRSPVPARGAPEALKLGKSVLLSDINDGLPGGVKQEGQIAQLIGALGLRSLISVPLIVRDKVLGTATFSSSRRRYEQEDLKLAEELAQRAAVAIDTAMLFREAESANRYKDAFLGTVAHELRTPLTSIVGWIQLAKLSPDMCNEALDRIDESVELMRVFTEDLLDVTRIREKKLSMDLAEVDFATIVRSAVKITEATAIAKKIDLQLRLDLDPAMLAGDEVRLLQVGWNLLSNAIKFTPSGGHVDVRLERDGTFARLSVIDTGIGISADFAPHAFELFRQAEPPGGHVRGLGIGLSIVAQIVELHGGTVQVESRGAGLGSTFIVRLPLLKETE